MYIAQVNIGPTHNTSGTSDKGYSLLGHNTKSFYIVMDKISYPKPHF